VDARTEITTQLLSEQGYSLSREDGEGEDQEQTFFSRDFERKLFSEKTNQVLCRTFLENALKDPLNGEIGKSVIFCVSQNHASKITQMLNQLAERYWPEKYNSDFAVQVTSSIPNSQQFAGLFANNNLNGKSRILPGYDTGKTRVCVTVGMMTTGYDCRDILNLGLLRPIFSPTDFIQIKGRGTRKFTFHHQDAEGEIQQAEKSGFKLFDFFANCEYFEEKFNYDEVLKLPVAPSLETGNGEGGSSVLAGEVHIYTPDPLKTLLEIPIGPQGMKIDRKFFEKFEAAVKNHPQIQEKYQAGDLAGAEELVRGEIFDRPQDYFNLEKLRKSVKADRKISLKEFIVKIFGGIDKFKSKDELLEEEFQKFVLVAKPENPEQLPLLKHYFKAYLTDQNIQKIVQNRDYAKLATNPKLNLSEFSALGSWKDQIPDYIQDYIFQNPFL